MNTSNCRLLLAFFIVTNVFLCGCAMIVNSGNDEVYFDSEPQGAQVYCNEEYLGDTPFIYEFSRFKDYSIIYRLGIKKVYSAEIYSVFKAQWLLYDLIFPPNWALLLLAGFAGAKGGQTDLHWTTDGYFNLDKDYIFSYLEDQSKQISYQNLSEKERSDFITKRARISQGKWIVRDCLDSSKTNLKIIEMQNDSLRTTRFNEYMAFNINEISSIRYDGDNETWYGIKLGFGLGLSAGFLYDVISSLGGDTPMNLYGTALGVLAGSVLGGWLGSKANDYECDLENLNLNDKKRKIKDEIFPE